jgi:hypothetical protein
MLLFSRIMPLLTEKENAALNETCTVLHSDMTAGKENTKAEQSYHKVKKGVFAYDAFRQQISTLSNGVQELSEWLDIKAKGPGFYEYIGTVSRDTLQSDIPGFVAAYVSDRNMEWNSYRSETPSTMFTRMRKNKAKKKNRQFEMPEGIMQAAFRARARGTLDAQGFKKQLITATRGYLGPEEE